MARMMDRSPDRETPGPTKPRRGFFDMAEAGTYLARRGMVALMLPVGDAEIEHVADAIGTFLSRLHPLLAA